MAIGPPHTIRALHGLLVQTDLPLQAPRVAAERADVVITYREDPIQTPLPRAFTRRWTHGPDLTELAFDSGNGHCLRFRYAADGAQVDIHNTVANDAATVAAILAGPGLAVLLALRDSLVLHGASVVVGDRATIFVGAAGRGKSTFAAALVRAGAPFLTEEVVALRRQGATFQTSAGEPRIALEPDAAEFFGGPLLPRVYPGRPATDKRWFDVPCRVAATGPPIDVGAVYVLGERAGSTVSCAPMPSAEATSALLRSLYPRTGLAAGRNMRFVAALVDATPVWALGLPPGLETLAGSAEAVIAHATAHTPR